MERWYKTLKRECIRPGVPLCVDDARRIVARFVDEYDNVRLHSGIGYIAPIDRLEGRDQLIIKERHRKLGAARLARHAARRKAAPDGSAGSPKEVPTTPESLQTLA